MALKSLFFPAKSQKSPSGWEFCPHTPSMMRLSCNSLFSMGPKLDNFCGKNLLMALFPLSKFWLRFWSHLLLLTDFSSDYVSRIRSELRNAAGVMCLFFCRHEYEIFKIAHNLHEPSQLTAKQRFSYSDFVTDFVIKRGFGQDGSGDSKNTFRIALLSQWRCCSKFVAVSCRGPLFVAVKYQFLCTKVQSILVPPLSANVPSLRLLW